MRSRRKKADATPRLSSLEGDPKSPGAAFAPFVEQGQGGVDPSVWTNETASAQAHRAAQARKSSMRRRNVDPATCERDYTAAELEFMSAMSEYKRRSGRMFPTWSEVLEVLQSLGYCKKGELTYREAEAV